MLYLISENLSSQTVRYDDLSLEKDLFLPAIFPSYGSELHHLLSKGAFSGGVLSGDLFFMCKGAFRGSVKSHPARGWMALSEGDP